MILVLMRNKRMMERRVLSLQSREESRSHEIQKKKSVACFVLAFH